MSHANISVEKHDLVRYASGVEGHFKDNPDRLESVRLAVEALERGESVALLSGGVPTGTTMRAKGSRYVEEKT